MILKKLNGYQEKNNMETTVLKPNVDEHIDSSKENKGFSLVLYNDNVNSFDWVIFNLITYCGHGTIQAEQCALIVHSKGKYAVKHGDIESLLPISESLSKNNLTVEIQN